MAILHKNILCEFLKDNIMSYKFSIDCLKGLNKLCKIYFTYREKVKSFSRAFYNQTLPFWN